MSCSRRGTLPGTTHCHNVQRAVTPQVHRGHLTGSKTTTPADAPHLHHLSPTFFLERAAAIEPDAQAIYHVTANNVPLSRTYAEFSKRTRGLAYYLQSHGYKRVGVLAPNTPAFLE